MRDSSATGKELFAAVDARHINGTVVIGEVAGVTRYPDRRVTRLATMCPLGARPSSMTGVDRRHDDQPPRHIAMS